MNTEITNKKAENQAAVSVSAFLVGKAQTDFWKWYLLPETLESHKLKSQHKFSSDNVIKVGFLADSKVCQNALIIEWLDTVNIYITSKLFDHDVDYAKWQFSIRNYINTPYKYYSRQEAYFEAIKQANIIYNAKFVDNTEAEH
jgi:hypothetical protein